VCQPAVPVLAAAALMAAEGDPCRPASMILVGAPIDPRINPTRVDEMASGHTLEWFERSVIHPVPPGRPGAGRLVYPGFLQLQGFLGLNLERHLGAHLGLIEDVVRGDAEAAARSRAFYDEYFSVMDLPAEYFLQTVSTVFQEFHLPRGIMVSRGRAIDPARIFDTALMTVEGEDDDITGIGQTEAAHRLCSGLASDLRRHHLQPKVGHYGLFNGSRWREEIHPHVRDFIRTHRSGAVLAD
jgi:poly(3-hydroxybutyrate) depolymerase